MGIKTVADVNVAGKRVLMRVDFNVPLEKGVVKNDRRIVQALPTIKHLLDQGAKLVLMTHLGRPAEKGYEEEFSVKPVAERLSELLGRPVLVGPPEVAGPAADKMVEAMKEGDVLLLENVRFDPGETMEDKAKKNPDKRLNPEQQAKLDDFVARLARLGEVYVNDAFGTCHRKHASMYGVAKAISAKGGPAVAGFLVQKEVRYLQEALEEPKRPFIAVLGGAKVSDKIRLISNLLSHVDRILIGGAMAYTLLMAKGVRVGKSLVEADLVEEMKALLERSGTRVILPVDHIASDENGRPVTIDGRDIPDDLKGMDIGPKTALLFAAEIGAANTIVWNGPMGVFEKEEFSAGTKAVAEAMASSTARGAITIIGGGDSAAAIEEFGLAEKVTHVSTGGGASIEFLEGRPMPPLEVLDRT